MVIINVHRVIFIPLMKSAFPHRKRSLILSVRNSTWGPLKLMISDWRSQSDYSLIITKQRVEESCNQTQTLTVLCPIDVHNHFVISCLKGTTTTKCRATCNWRIMKGPWIKIYCSRRVLGYLPEIAFNLCASSCFRSTFRIDILSVITYAHLTKIHDYKPNANCKLSLDHSFKPWANSTPTLLGFQNKKMIHTQSYS